ncbi:MAG: hypothetical protein GC129_02835 [Proteobacteria bacterium]|nr:hypothetical protein [Pseudomonadota bacterium]
MNLRAQTIVVSASTIANIFAAFQLADEAKLDRIDTVRNLLPHATDDELLAALRALCRGATLH